MPPNHGSHNPLTIVRIECPYELLGVSHLYYPDFIVRLTNGVNLVLEIKGYEREGDKAKHEAARRWCEAVTNWGKLGKWQFHVSKEPNEIQANLKSLNVVG